jgi:hypothetical protein
VTEKKKTDVFTLLPIDGQQKLVNAVWGEGWEGGWVVVGR